LVLCRGGTGGARWPGDRVRRAPFGSRDGLGRPVGFEIELARLFARVLFEDDRRVELVPVTVATWFEVLQSGRIDLAAATITATDERRTLAELSDPYASCALRARRPRGKDRRSASRIDERRSRVRP
jgi:membrane-bound lytic murein transglycosylase MltF